MQETIEAKVSREMVWTAWERAHGLYAKEPLEAGAKAKRTGFRYKILEAVPREKFSILWKSLFVRMVFTHTVTETQKGSLIQYSVEVKGLFAWIVRFFLRKKIQKSLSKALKEFVHQLERASIKNRS